MATIERPKLSHSLSTSFINTGEAFQNNVLRPVIKEVHYVILKHFSAHLAQKKNQYFKLEEQTKAEYVVKIFKTDTAYKKELRGIIIGQFSEEEFDTYLQIKSDIDLRINKIVLQRILTNQSDLKAI